MDLDQLYTTLKREGTVQVKRPNGAVWTVQRKGTEFPASRAYAILVDDAVHMPHLILSDSELYCWISNLLNLP